MSKSDLRKKLFETHSADLHSICPDVDNAFRCPICLSLYSVKDLDGNLTDGHIWPKECKAPKVRTNQKWKGQDWYSTAAKALGVAPPKAA